MPKVSVVMLCYNHEKYVGEAIRSVLDQSYTDFELLIADNGCTDNSYEIMKSFDDSRVKIFRLEKNDPEKAARVLMENQTGIYMANICSDDLWEKSKLEKQMIILEKNPDILLSATWAMFINDNMEVLEWSIELFQKKNRSRLEWLRYLLENGNCLAASSMVGKSNLVMAAFGISYGYWQLSDYYGWLIALKRTNIYIVEEVLVKQRIHNGVDNANVSFPNKKNNIRSMTEGAILVFQVIESLDDADFLEMYRDKLINRNANTHLEIICEKFFLLLEYAKLYSNFENNVLYYFYKYYGYEENGIYVSAVLKEKYGYSYMDFRDISATMGSVALKERKNEKIAQLQKKMRNLLPIKEKGILKEVNEELLVCITYLQNGCLDMDLLKKIIIILENILLIWDWMSYMEIGIKKEEIELCKQLCSIYQKNLNIADCNELLTNVLRYQKAVQELII